MRVALPTLRALRRPPSIRCRLERADELLRGSAIRRRERLAWGDWSWCPSAISLRADTRERMGPIRECQKLSIARLFASKFFKSFVSGSHRRTSAQPYLTPSSLPLSDPISCPSRMSDNIFSMTPSMRSRGLPTDRFEISVSGRLIFAKNALNRPRSKTLSTSLKPRSCRTSIAVNDWRYARSARPQARSNLLRRLGGQRAMTLIVLPLARVFRWGPYGPDKRSSSPLERGPIQSSPYNAFPTSSRASAASIKLAPLEGAIDYDPAIGVTFDGATIPNRGAPARIASAT